MILILHFQLCLNATRKVGGFVESCWVSYPKKDTNLRKEILAAKRLMLQRDSWRQVIQKSPYLTYCEWERKV